MGVLEKAIPIINICTRDVGKTAAFYRDVLGLTQKFQDRYAVVFRAGGMDLRVSHVPDFVPTAHTGLSFKVVDIVACVRTLREKGVVFHHAEHLTLDDDGIWTVPGGLGQVAWLADPEGNMLSITTV